MPLPEVPGPMNYLRRDFSEGGPPDPISYLRRISGDESSSDDEMKRSEDASGGDERTKEVQEPPRRKRRIQDPPARARPEEGQAWPYRDTLSFTRSLIFYGAGAVTHEHERACKDIQECRDMRQK